MKLLIVLLFLPVLVFGQIGITAYPFKTVANDSIATITQNDSVYIQLNDGPWLLLTSTIDDTAYVTVTDKVGEVTKVFDLANETFWTYTPSLRFRIIATGTDTITSPYVGTGGLNGSLTLFLRPDTSGTNTRYDNSTLEGR